MKFRLPPYLAALSALVVVVQVALPNSSQPLATIQTEEWQSGWSLAFWLGICGSLLALLTGITLFKWTQTPVKLRAAVQEATDKLRESELQYRELVENANSIILKVDAVGNITFFNEFAQSFFGYSEEEIIVKNAIGTIIPQTDTSGNDLAAMGRDILQHPERYVSNEHENIRRNGELVWVSWRNKALVDDKGGFKGILAIGHEISRRKQAEKAQQQSYTLLQAVIEGIPDPIFAKDLQGRYVLANSATVKAFDRQPEDVIGCTDRELLPPEIAQDFLEIDRQIITTGKSITYSQNIPLSSEVRTFLTTKSVYHDSEGNAMGVIGISRDITERKQAEIALQQANQELENRVERRTTDLRQTLEQLQIQIAERQQAEEAVKESEAKFQNLSANVPGMLYQFLLRADGSGSYPYISPACREIFELEPETVQKNITLIHDLIHPDDRQNYDQLVAHAAQTLQPWNWEGRFITPSGKIKWIQSISQPEALANGDSIWHGLITDITDRKLAEEALRESEERWQLALKGSNDGIWDWNLKINESFVSPRMKEMLGYEDQELANHADEWINRTHPEDVGKMMKTFQDHLEGKTPYYVKEFRQRCKDGTYKWILSRGQALWDEDGKPMRVVGSNADITERKQTEEALQQSEAQERERAQQLEQALLQLRSTQAQLIQTEKMSSLGQLVAGMAHEINNPVNFIHGNLTYVNDYVQDLLGLIELYQQEYSQPSEEILCRIEEIELDFMSEDLPKILSSMKVGTQRIRSIVLSLRNFSRLDESDMKQVDIHEGIESTLLILQNRFKGKNNSPDIQLVKEFGKLPLVECYAGQLNQVFVNIIANAIDAIEQRCKGLSVEEIASHAGQITISTKVRDRETATIEISDNGVGISEAVKTQIFNPFFTTKEVGKGTGLGMSISYRIVVEQHKGKLDYISEIGKGTTFIVEIPIGQSC